MLSVNREGITIDGELVPGVYQGMEVNGSVVIDAIKTENGSGKKKQTSGWDDYAVTLSLLLLDDENSTSLAKLRSIAGMFKKTDANGSPKIYLIAEEDLEAMDIDYVIFSELKLTTTNEDNQVRLVELNFVEWEPVVKKVQVQKFEQVAEALKQPVTSVEVAEAELVEDVPPNVNLKSFFYE